MALEYQKQTKVLCRFRGEELKAAMEQQHLSAYMLAKAIGVYPAKIRDWKKSKFVTLESDLMVDLNSALDCSSIKKIL